MATQTGSIDFKSTKGFQSYASGQYATLTQVKGQFATCSTAAGTQAKAATIVPSDTGWELYTGATITVRFTADNTHATPTLNVNSTGAKSIRDHTGAALTEEAYKWKAGDALTFTYDGTYWRMQDTLAQRVTTNKTAIEQNASDILLRATKEEAAQMAQPNLSPYFSSSPYDRTANSYWYGMGVNSNYTFTDMGDGWMRVQCTNSGSSVIRVDWYPIKCPSVVAGQPYTWLAEVRNNASTSASSGSDFYLVQNNNCQFWGQKAIETIEGPSGTGMSINTGTCGSSYVLQKVQNAETASDGHWTNNDEASVVGLACWTFRCAANSSIDYEVRLSLYEGRYAGPYKPYVGSQLYASRAELKVANDAISLRATKEEVEKTYSTKDEVQIDRSGSGTSVTVEGTANAALKSLHVLGESVQDGTPTPSAPVPIVSVSGVNVLLWSDENDTYTDHTNVDRRWMFTTIYGTYVVNGNTVTFTKNSSGLTNTTSGIRVSAMLASGAAATTANSASLSFGLDLKAGDTLTFSCDVKTSGNRVALHAQYYNGSNRWTDAGGITEYGAPADTDWHRYSHTFTVASNYVSLTALGIYCELTDGVTISARNFKLEIGGTNGLYVPYGHAGLWVRGRNLVGNLTAIKARGAHGTWNGNTYVDSGVSYVFNEDGSIVTNGTSTALTFIQLAESGFLLPAGTYHLSGCPEGGGTTTYRLDVERVGVSVFAADEGSGTTFTLDTETNVNVRLRVPNGATLTDKVFQPMLRLASTDAEFEPYTESVTPIPLNGHELRSLPDGTRDELTVDVDGHVTMTQRVGSVTLDGSETWTMAAKASSLPNYAGSYWGFTPSPSDASERIIGGIEALSNKYAVPHPKALSGYTDNEAGINNTNISSVNRIFVMDSTLTSSASDFKAVLASSPMEMTYLLATPQTIDLGTIDMPQVKDGDTVEVIAALTPSIDVTWWASAGQAVADAYASLSSAIEVKAESIVSTVSERYATSQEVQAISSQITQTAQGWTAQFNQLTGGADLSMTLAEAFDALGVTSRNLEEIRSFVRITTDDAGDPLLLMGSATSPIMLALSNDSLRFMHGSDPVAYIDVDGTTNEGKLHITRAVVVKELQFGSWKWFERDGVGNLALKWVGDE